MRLVSSSLKFFCGGLAIVLATRALSTTDSGCPGLTSATHAQNCAGTRSLASTNKPDMDPSHRNHTQDEATYFYIGLGLAVSSTIFIGSSFIIKKKALMRIGKVGGVRAGAGGFGYLKDWMWWAGLLTMGVGEASNFAAYAFAPAALVTPLGALSVLVSAVLASHFLNEKLNLLGKLGCFLCILGSTVIVIHAPHEEEVESLNLLIEKLKEPSFIVFQALIVILAFVLACYIGPVYGHRYVVVYVLLCSSVGSVTVLGCKGLGLAIKESIIGEESSNTANWTIFILLFVVVLCIMVQMNYLNKALDLFNTGIVTPVYYVLFTTFVVLASALLFREWENMSFVDFLGSGCGFLIVIVSIILLNTFKDVDVSVMNVRGMMRPKRELVASNMRPFHSVHVKEEEPISRHGAAKMSSYGSDFHNTI